MKSTMKTGKLVLTALLMAASLTSEAISASQFQSQRITTSESTTEPMRTNPSSHTGPTSLGVPFQQNCYQGFNKGTKVMKSTKMIDYYICYSNTISCPAFLQDNGLYASVTPIAIVKPKGGGADSGGPKRFTIQYKCDYFFNAQPEG